MTTRNRLSGWFLAGAALALALAVTAVAAPLQPAQARCSPAVLQETQPAYPAESQAPATLPAATWVGPNDIQGGAGTEQHLPIVFKHFHSPPPPICQELITDGRFDTDTAWTVPGTNPRPGRYTAELALSPSRSMLLGLKPGEPDVRSYSSASQTVSIPANANQATLSFWIYPVSGLDSDDRQECLLLNESGAVKAVLLRINSNAGLWEHYVLDLSAYAGQTVRVYFNAYNDGSGTGTAGMYLDDVSLQSCEEGPIPEPVPGCYPALWLEPEVGDAPHGVAVDGPGRRLYVANHDDDTLSILSTLSYQPVGTVAVGAGPNGVAYNPLSGRVYVANGGDNSVTVVQASNQTPLAGKIPVGAQPNGVAVDRSNNWVYVANWGDGTVSVIDAATNSVVRTVTVGAEPAMVAVHQGLSKAYVALHGAGALAAINAAGQVTVIDLYASGPYGVAVDEVRNLVYVAAIDSGRIVAVDAEKDEYLGWAEIRRMSDEALVPLRQIAVNPDIGTSGHLFVTTAGADGGANRVLMLPKGWDEGLARAHALPLDEPREGIAFEPGVQRVYVTSRTGDRVAVVLDGEPACPNNFAAGEEFQITVCVAGLEQDCK